LYFLEDDTGQLHVVDTRNGATAQLGAPLGATGNVALTSSDVKSQLFGSTGTTLQRINTVDGSSSFVAAIDDLEV
jgi:hypothetical protein